MINNDITTWRVDKRIFEGRYRSTYPSRLLRRSVVSSEKLIHRYVESGRADTLRSQYENEGRVWWWIYTTGSSTISRHYDRIMIVIHVGAQKGQTVTLILPKWSPNHALYIVTFEICRSHLHPPLQLWSRDDKSRFPFDRTSSEIVERIIGRGEPRALVIYI